MRFESSAGFKSPGFDISDVGFFRRADDTDDEQLAADPQRQAERGGSAAGISTSISTPTGTTTAIGSAAAATSTPTPTSPTTGRSAAASTSTRAYFDDRADARRSGRAVRGLQRRLVVRQHRRPARGVVQLQRQRLRRRASDRSCREYEPARHRSRPMPALSVVAGMRDRDLGRRHAMGEQRHRYQSRTTCSAAWSRRRCRSTAGSATR